MRTDAHRLVEECMLCANVCAATLLGKSKLPVLYRVHKGPREEKLENLRVFLGELGLGLPGGNEPTAQDYQAVLEQAAHRPDADIIQSVMLRSMTQAVYQPQNVGHFGLHYEAYTHFTSPIRRYPDLLVHRAVRALLRSNKRVAHVKRCPDAESLPLDLAYPYSLAHMLEGGEHCSMTERRADEATRSVMDWLKCEYLLEHVGEEFRGVVSAVTGFGIFVELQPLYIDGLVHITGLPKDYYHHEAAHHRLVGERTGRSFHLGDVVQVRVARVDLDERKIDLELIDGRQQGSGNKKSRGRKKPRGRGGQAGSNETGGKTGGKKTVRASAAKAANNENKSKTTNQSKTKKAGATNKRKKKPAARKSRKRQGGPV